MVVKMSSPGRSFGGVADYCLHDPRMPGEAHHPESAERVEWTETRNLATSEGERAGRIMAATAEASPELKRLAGVAATGRKLEKPVCHYSLSWAKDEKPDRQEMRWAAQESLKALGMERHQALVVSHRDGQPHVHVIANRVDPESGKAAGLNRSKLKLSKWAEEYERGAGENPVSAAGEEQCEAGARETGSGSGLAPDRAAPAGGDEPAAAGAASDPGGPGRVGRPGPGAGGLEAGRGALGVGAASEAAWPGARGTGETEQAGVVGALRASPAAAGILGERLPRGAGGASGYGGSWAAKCERSAGRSGETRKCWDASGRSWRSGYAGTGFRWEKSIPKRCGGSRARRENFTARAWKGRRNGRGMRRGRTGSQCVTVGVVTNLTHSSTRCWRSGWSRWREIDGEPAYGKMRRALEKASQQEKASQEEARQARQVESARLERAMQETARQSRGRRGPERGGPDRDFGPSR